MYRRYKEVRSLQELSFIQDSLPKHIYKNVAEITEIYDVNYTTRRVDGGGVVWITSLYDFNNFFKDHPQLDINEMMEYIEVIEGKNPDEQDYVNILLLAGTEYHYNIFMPKSILSDDEKGAELLYG